MKNLIVNFVNFSKLITGLTSLTLVGCAAIAPPASQSAGGLANQQAFEGTDITTDLLKTAQSVESSLKMLALGQSQYHPQTINTAPLISPQGGMGGHVAIDWSGQIEPLLEKIASLSNYRVKYIGLPPPIPVIVSISSKDSVLADVLKDAGLQAGRRASVIAYPDSRIIELRYANMSA